MSAERTGETMHFTADSGWINDPHGICWSAAATTYSSMHCPDTTTWAPDCHRGHAVSADLVRWQRQPIALAGWHGRDDLRMAYLSDPDGATFALAATPAGT